MRREEPANDGYLGQAVEGQPGEEDVQESLGGNVDGENDPVDEASDLQKGPELVK